MKKPVKTALILICFLLISAKSSLASVLTDDKMKEEIKTSIQEQIKGNLQGDVTINIGVLPFKNVSVPDGKVRVVAEINSKYFSTNMLARINIYVNGESVKTFGVPISFEVRDYVWVAKDQIQRGKAFNPKNVALEKKDISSFMENAARQNFDIGASLAGKTYKVGDIIDQRYIEKTPDVLRNSQVSVILQSDSVTITFDGEALENGKIGDFIRVKSKRYNKFYTAKVVSENVVIINI